MTIKKIAFLFLITLSSTSFASNYDGYFIDEKLDYPAFIGECSALLEIFTHGEDKADVYKTNHEKYLTLIDNLNNEKKQNRSAGFRELFFSKISGITQPTEEEYWGLRNDLSVCAYWTDKKLYQYSVNNQL